MYAVCNAILQAVREAVEVLQCQCNADAAQQCVYANSITACKCYTDTGRLRARINRVAMHSRKEKENADSVLTLCRGFM